MKTIYIFAAVLTLAALAFALPVFNDFSVRVVDRTAVLECTSGNEAGLASYTIERSFDGLTFREIATQSAKGNQHTYLFTDRDLFKGQPHVYYYRVVGKLSNNTSIYSEVGRVTIDASGISRTWGSLKAMFR